MMSVVTSRLSFQQEMKLCSLLGHVKLSLLYKATVHNCNAAAFHQKCDRQGPTVSVAYNNSGYIFGGYISKDFSQTGLYIADDKAFLFSFNENEDNKAPLRVVSTNPQNSFYDTNTGPNFSSMVLMNNNTMTVNAMPGTYQFDPVEMHGNDTQLTELEVYRVEGLGLLMEKPWRTIKWGVEKRTSLMNGILSWTPSVSSVQNARVLLVGAVGAGKSSFFNSVRSIFKGHVTLQANTGTAGTSLTTQFRVYSIKVGSKVLPITLCDSMGLEEGLNAGLDIEDFTNILKGHIQDKYQCVVCLSTVPHVPLGHLQTFLTGQWTTTHIYRHQIMFNPSMPLQVDSFYYCKSPTPKERIHTVVYVMDACKIKLLSDKMIDKLAAFRRKANHMEIPQMVLLTKVDEACSVVAEDLKQLYQSHYIYRMMQEVSVCLGVSLSAVVPVKNYSKELDIDTDTDIVLLNALQQIIRTCEVYYDEYNEDEAYCKKNKDVTC